MPLQAPFYFDRTVVVVPFVIYTYLPLCCGVPLLPEMPHPLPT